MTTVTSEIDAQRAAQIADRLRSIATAAEPALESAELVFLDETADFLDDAAGVERGERVIQSPATGQSSGETDRFECVECGKDLTDPKNCGDPDVSGDWVCADDNCRIMHDPDMTVNRRVIRS